MAHMRLALELPPEAASVAATRHAVDCALEAIGVAADPRGDIGVAVSEACTNVVRHADTSRCYAVTVTADSGRCTVEVRDQGVLADASRLARPWPASWAEGGRGLHIIRAVMDGVEIGAGPAGGLAIRMVKQLIRGKLQNGMRRIERPPAGPAGPPGSEDAPPAGQPRRDLP